MKSIKLFWIASLIVVLSLACDMTQPAQVDNKSNRSGDTIIFVDNPISLTNLLARLPGVRIDDFGPNPQIYVRGGAPLFVLDGINLGRDFNSVQRLVDINSIAAVELLTDPSETMRYAGGSLYGVVVIHTGTFDLEER